MSYSYLQVFFLISCMRLLHVPYCRCNSLIADDEKDDNINSIYFKLNDHGTTEVSAQINMTDLEADRFRNEVCKLNHSSQLSDFNYTSSRPKNRVAVLFRGESFRNDFFQYSRSTCCETGLVIQEVIFEHHKAFFEQIVKSGFQGVDVFGTTYACPNSNHSKYNHLERLLQKWYKPWLEPYGSFRILNSSKVTAQVHARAVIYDFWRAVMFQWGGFEDHPYDFVLHIRWDFLIHNFSACIFQTNNALDMDDFSGTDGDLLHVVPRRHLSCWRGMVQIDQVKYENKPYTKFGCGGCNCGCSSHLRQLVDGVAVLHYPLTEYDRADREFKHREKGPLYVTPSCRRQAGSMFLSRKRFMPKFFKSENVTSGCVHTEEKRFAHE